MECQKYIVYGYQNKITLQWYIGITSEEREEKRKKEHFSGSVRKFTKALIEFGKDNFTYIVFEKGITKDEVLERETYYISFFKSVSNGYNVQNEKTIYEDELSYLYNKLISNLTIKRKEILEDMIRWSKLTEEEKNQEVNDAFANFNI